MISSFEGIFQIRTFDDIINTNLLIFDNKSIQTFCWISKWAIYSILPFGKRYIQLDASFYALSPYVYCVPLAIINNASLPLGLVIGPSEHQNLFNEFFNLLESYNLLFHIKDFPILSDQSTAIRIFVNLKK